MKVSRMPLQPGLRLLVQPFLSLRPRHKGTFDHMHKGGELVYFEDGCLQAQRCTPNEVLAIYTPAAEELIKL